MEERKISKIVGVRVIVCPVSVYKQRRRKTAEEIRKFPYEDRDEQVKGKKIFGRKGRKEISL